VRARQNARNLAVSASSYEGRNGTAKGDRVVLPFWHAVTHPVPDRSASPRRIC
jgi:hypothetical protein